MKKLTFILAAAACLFLTSCTTESSCTYIIEHGVLSHSASGNPTSEAVSIYADYTDEVIAFDKAHENDWRWTLTVKNEKYGPSDDEALAKYETYRTELEAIHSKYADKLDKCTATDYWLSHLSYFKLYRISSSNADLAYKEYTMSYGK